MAAGQFERWLVIWLVVSLGRCRTVVAASGGDARRDHDGSPGTTSNGGGELGGLSMSKTTRANGMPGGRVGYE
eukprot:CAMPEP_0182595716 /NCGR_PEP_ID=MMETSP1324-20130603/82809_1 /TAXON_ID=236786 /ORGANISM="Florenciella sp., Strain RCC1587" /LENGTH=72 /DNA_ID=CAMNT_0024813337 /DNA_START=86 /DNA_END=301 /DNA_ORIENTATION=-